MSGEQISADRNIKTPQEISFEQEKDKPKVSGRVNINNLMSKVREEEKKQRKENLIFFSAIGSVIIITGIIASF